MGNSKSLSVGSQINSGQTLYTIDKLLGQGGFGITYKVTGTFKHGKIEQRGCFAMKEHFVGDFCERDHDTGCVRFSAPVKDKVEESLNDFIAEARRLNSLDHPNIVAVNEVFEANDTAYYVMEYIEGKSLREYITDNKPLAEQEALTVMTPILNAVEYLHAHRMTHLDIKPDNIMLKPSTEGDFTPILIDFGLSKHYDEKGRPTSTIRIQGCSAGYAPMEQYVGIESFTPQADVYALGATMLYLLTGCQPEVASAQNSDKILSSLPAAVSDKIRQAIVRAMQPNKDNRTQSVADFARDLGIELTGTAASTISASSLTQQLGKKNPPAPKRWITPLLIGCGVLLVVVLTVFLMNPFDPNDPKDLKDSNDSIISKDTTAVQPVEVPAAPAVEVVDESVDDGYSVAYAGALNLYNSRKYADCKRECQKLLRQYTSREQKQQLNQLIEYCDTALAAEETAQQAAQQQATPAPTTSGGGSSANLPGKAVDLGLSVLWADRNVGASSPSDYGGYYAWGETSTKSDYSWSTYTHCDGNWDNCHNIGSNIAGTRYDVARQKRGGGWKMPTKSQWQELIDNCTWTWTTQGGHSGYKVTSKKNGNSIFLPTTGSRGTTSVYYGDDFSFYWSSTLYDSRTNFAWHLNFGSDCHYVDYNGRCLGFTVRPVCDK